MPLEKREEQVDMKTLVDNDGHSYLHLAMPRPRRVNLLTARRLLVRSFSEPRPHKRNKLVRQAKKLIDQEVGQ